MPLSAAMPALFTAERQSVAQTGSCVLVASGPASARGTFQVAGHLDADLTWNLAGMGTFASAVKCQASLTVTAGKKLIIPAASASSHAQNQQVGYVTIASAGSTVLVNNFIISQYTPILLSRWGGTTTDPAVPRIMDGRQSAGSAAIGLFYGVTPTAGTGKVYYMIVPEA